MGECRIRVPYPFQWGAPTFDAGEAFAMMAASFVALVEVSLIFMPFFYGLKPLPADVDNFPNSCIFFLRNS